jgi:ATP-dependent Clp protease ATP-binding subunit ClpB
MNLQRFTNKAQEAVIGAQSLANEYGHSQIDPLHLLASCRAAIRTGTDVE